MSANGRTEKEIWESLEGLDDDFLDMTLPEAVIDEELRAMQIDTDSLMKRGNEFVATVKSEVRLSWQDRAKQRQAELEARVLTVADKVPADMDRAAILRRLDQLRTSNPEVGSAIMMAARKRKPEESTTEELKALLAEMEALRAIEGKGE